MEDRQAKDILTKVAEEVAESIKPRERGPRTRRSAPRRYMDAEDRKERRERNRMRAECRKKTRRRRRHGRPVGR